LIGFPLRTCGRVVYKSSNKRLVVKDSETYEE
jgi:hypothetical protein